VIDNTSGKQVAIMHNQQDEDLYTKQTYCLGRYYNDALIGLEVNFSTYPTKELQRLGYHRQYMREEEDSISGRIEKRFGFKTTKLTRPLIISALVEIVREHTNLINDIQTLHEMLTFVRDEKGKPTAKQGAHDDLIMSLAIAHYIRGQQSYLVDSADSNDDDYEDDDEENYRDSYFT
jgi:phage terminase large subunit